MEKKEKLQESDFQMEDKEAVENPTNDQKKEAVETAIETIKEAEDFLVFTLSTEKAEPHRACASLHMCGNVGDLMESLLLTIQARPNLKMALTLAMMKSIVRTESKL